MMIQGERWMKTGAEVLPAQLERIYTRYKRGLMPQSEFFSKMDRLLAGKSIGTLTWEHGMYPRISREWLDENLSRVTELVRLHDEFERVSAVIEAKAWKDPNVTPGDLAEGYSAWMEDRDELDAAYLRMNPKGYFIEGKLAHRPSVAEDGTFRMAKTDEDFEAFVGAWIESIQRLVDGLKSFALDHKVAI